MSAEEMRDYCLGTISFGLRVQVRLKNGSEILTGRITSAEVDRFNLVSDDDQSVQQLRYAWVARIRNA